MIVEVVQPPLPFAKHRHAVRLFASNRSHFRDGEVEFQHTPPAFIIYSNRVFGVCGIWMGPKSDFIPYREIEAASLVPE